MTLDAESFHERPDALQERLSAYLDDMLAAEERGRLEAHLAGCGACRQQLAHLGQVRALLRQLPQPALPRSFALPMEVAAAGPSRPTPLRSIPRRRRASRAASAVHWLGTGAALLGLALLLGTAVLGGGRVVTTSSGAAPASGAAGASSDTAHSSSDNKLQQASPATSTTFASTGGTPSAPSAGTPTTPALSGGKQGGGTSASSHRQAEPQEARPPVFALQ